MVSLIYIIYDIYKAVFEIAPPVQHVCFIMNYNCAKFHVCFMCITVYSMNYYTKRAHIARYSIPRYTPHG